jgi:hypothetical protein
VGVSEQAFSDGQEPDQDDSDHFGHSETATPAGDVKAQRRSRIKQFWDAAGMGGGWLAHQPAEPDNDALLRGVGLSGELPKDDDEWDLHLDWKRAQSGLGPDVDRETAERVANILTRGRQAIASALIRRKSQRRAEAPGVSLTGNTQIDSKSERTRSRRDSNVA